MVGPVPFQLEGDILSVLDQRHLPHRVIYRKARNAFDVARLIRKMVVRGAPMIAIVSAYGLYLQALRNRRNLRKGWEALKNSRPTAVNLHNVLREVFPLVESNVPAKDLLEFARTVENRERRINEAIGRWGVSLFERPLRVLTYCNTGMWATIYPGTALGIIRFAHRKKLVRHVYVPETSPYMQGSRLTAYEMQLEGISYSVIPDNHIPFVMERGMVDIAIVGADRITSDNYVFNKIGTLSVALAAKRFGIPFVVAAPSTTFQNAPYSSDIPIEKRDDVPREDYLYYAFDITPPDLIYAIVSEEGIRKVTSPDL
ncbi:MAG: S-methyl-5-thioribose-1-phosphate isomerase [Thermotogae bacterium]|nr:S-methyl-5-thioribose-1-phosphate isomerase [Thermotogota bacterium]